MNAVIYGLVAFYLSTERQIDMWFVVDEHLNKVICEVPTEAEAQEYVDENDGCFYVYASI